MCIERSDHPICEWKSFLVLWWNGVLAVWQWKRYTAGGSCYKNRRIKPIFNIKDSTHYREGTFSYYILCFGNILVSKNLISIIELILMKDAHFFFRLSFESRTWIGAEGIFI